MPGTDITIRSYVLLECGYESVRIVIFYSTLQYNDGGEDNSAGVVVVVVVVDDDYDDDECIQQSNPQ